MTDAMGYVGEGGDQKKKIACSNSNFLMRDEVSGISKWPIKSNMTLISSIDLYLGTYTSKCKASIK